MAEAMINEKYMQATLPTLPTQSPIVSSVSRSSPPELQDQYKQQKQGHHLRKPKYDEPSSSPLTEIRNPTNTAHQQRKVNFELPPTKRARRNPNVSNIQNVITGEFREQKVKNRKH